MEYWIQHGKLCKMQIKPYTKNVESRLCFWHFDRLQFTVMKFLLYWSKNQIVFIFSSDFEFSTNAFFHEHHLLFILWSLKGRFFWILILSHDLPKYMHFKWLSKSHLFIIQNLNFLHATTKICQNSFRRTVIFYNEPSQFLDKTLSTQLFL